MTELLVHLQVVKILMERNYMDLVVNYYLCQKRAKGQGHQVTQVKTDQDQDHLEEVSGCRTCHDHYHLQIGIGKST